MTRTHSWLHRWRADLVRREFGTALLLTVGAGMLALALGVFLGRLGVYLAIPVAVIATWTLVAAVIGAGVVWYRQRLRQSDVHRLAERVEHLGGLRRGSVAGVVDPSEHGSSALFAAADSHVSDWLNARGSDTLAPVRTQGRRSLQLSALAGVVGVSVLALSGPGTGRGASFWHPFAVLGASSGAVTLTLDRDEVRRGESVTLFIAAAGRRNATLWSREPGEPWATTPIVLDSAGNASSTIGPLQSDRFFRAVSGRSTSETLEVRVAFPAFLSDLVLSAEYPSYLERPTEPLYPGDSVVLPRGTQLTAGGSATVELSGAMWRIASRDSVALDASGNQFSGRTTVRRSGVWELVVSPASGRPLEDPAPVLHIVAVRDSVPEISVPVPGVDTTIAPSLRQLLVVDTRDDHGLTRVEITSWRVSRLGTSDEVVTEEIGLPQGGTDRAVLQWALDLNERGFLPGDTAYYVLRAFDNAPTPQVSETQTFILHLPSLADMRQAVRDQADALVNDTDSLLQAQEALAEETRDLAVENAADAADGRGDGEERMDFSSAEEASELGAEQEALMERAEELSDQLQELAETGWEAGITDPEWHRRLAELQEMLDKAITPEMQETLDQLQEALEQLDAEAVQQLMEELAEQQQQLREQLERSRELFERAALEGEMSTLADDASELSDRQDEWNEATENTEQSDSSLSAEEQALAAETEQLAEDLAAMQEAMEQAGQQGDMQQSQQRTEQAGQQMSQAAQQAQQGQRSQAQESGQAASENLQPVAQELREQLEEMREDWREEVLGMMDAALTETADLAERQEAVTERMERGQTGDDVRGEQAAIREGVDRVIERLQSASGKNALVSPNLSTALGLSRLKMTEALQELQEATPNSRQAGSRSGQALDGLNEVAYALLRNRGNVEGSESGSGMAEAMEQMAQMAQQQQSMASDAGQMLPMMGSGQQELMQQLQQMAEQQRRLGEELERMEAEGGPSGTEEMAEEALELARQLELGALDRETVERQEQLFRRMLDAGRTLRSDEEDDKKERESEAADQTNVRLPADQEGATGPQARYPYPKWEQLRLFSPDERRLILDYFRRLNAEQRR